MKTLREPKLWRGARIYYQPGSPTTYKRIRVIYPDGACEWDGVHQLDDRKLNKPCWARGYRTALNCDWLHLYWRSMGVFPTAEKALAAMRDYDKNSGFEPAEYLGEVLP